MSLPYQRKLIPRAKELRRDMTPQERHLWYDFLKDYPVRFQRQKAIDSFIIDFYCASAKLMIELDGSQHFSAQGLAYDEERSDVLSKYGLAVLRFTNTEIEKQFDVVCQRIHQEVEDRRIKYATVHWAVAYQFCGFTFLHSARF